MAPQALAALLAASLVACAHGQAPQREAVRDVVSFAAQASREVQNDELVAVMAVELHGPDPAALAEAVNQRMARALKRAAAYPSVKARSGNYQTFPRYREGGRTDGWQISQELRLESGDFLAATRLVGELQKELVVRSMALRVSPEARRAAEDALIAEAIGAFRARAELVRAAMNAAGYTIREVSIGPAGEAPPRPLEMRAMAAPVALEAGVTRVTVSAAGSIQLR